MVPYSLVLNALVQMGKDKKLTALTKKLLVK
jgi:hypothetical protein